MELINQRTKKIMEECKERAAAAGLQFGNETLEYIVTNRDLLELSPKAMIPTLYDYWIEDIEVLKNKAVYKVYPSNPYETVINSRPAISFYNDNNPDWLNIMIFYHVLAHIDFFQNNILFQHTWNDDFVGQALADKRLIAQLRTEHGRWCDYAIEFSRCINNLTNYYPKLHRLIYPDFDTLTELDFYFNIFLQKITNAPSHFVFKEIERYNNLKISDNNLIDAVFLAEVKSKHPEFDFHYKQFLSNPPHKEPDLMEYIRDNSPFLKKESNTWIKSIMTIVRNTALYFEPQIRTKIINEGWASYWHDTLFRSDDRIKQYETNYARVNAYVTAIDRIGLNPYAIGLRLIQHVENLADKGKISRHFQLLENEEMRNDFNENKLKGKEAIFELRKNFSDFMLIHIFCNQDFTNQHNLFTVGKRFNPQQNIYEYYVNSKKAEDYKKMLEDTLYHPPQIKVEESKTTENNLYLVHKFEGKQLYKDYIPETMMDIEYLWGNQVQLETTEIIVKKDSQTESQSKVYQKVLYTMKERKIQKTVL